jgi:hypothetical protein
VDRRNFLSGSLAASALSLATAGDLLAQAGSGTESAPEYMDLRRYHLASGPGVAHQCFFFRRSHSGTEPAFHWASRCVLRVFRTG